MCVVGNDSGEKFSILFGIFSWFDWDVLEYVGFYKDFNINYFLVNFVVIGGSFGSFIFDVDGDVVVFMCGGGFKIINFVLLFDLLMKVLVCLENGYIFIRGDI